MKTRLMIRHGKLVLGLLALSLVAPSVAHAQPAYYRTPNLEGAWIPPDGTLYFNFLHRFEIGAPPSYSVANLPTFQLSAGLLDRLAFGMAYATETLTVPGASQELSLYAKQVLLAEHEDFPYGLSLKEAYNMTAQSPDLELQATGKFGPVRVIGTARGMGNFRFTGQPRFTAGGGALVALTPYLQLTGDAAFSPMRAADEPPAVWGLGTLIQIPYTPHTLSLQATNASTSTIQGSSVATNAVRYGFDFTIPFSNAGQWAEIFKRPQPKPAKAAEAPKPATEKPAEGTEAPTAEEAAPSGFDGKAFFAANCASCHGAEGQGAFGPNLQDVEAKGDDLIAERILKGSPKGMPAFADKLTDAELKALVSFVKSL